MCSITWIYICWLPLGRLKTIDNARTLVDRIQHIYCAFYRPIHLLIIVWGCALCAHTHTQSHTCVCVSWMMHSSLVIWLEYYSRLAPRDCVLMRSYFAIIDQRMGGKLYSSTYVGSFVYICSLLDLRAAYRGGIALNYFIFQPQRGLPRRFAFNKEARSIAFRYRLNCLFAVIYIYICSTEYDLRYREQHTHNNKKQRHPITRALRYIHICARAIGRIDCNKIIIIKQRITARPDSGILMRIHMALCKHFPYRRCVR